MFTLIIIAILFLGYTIITIIKNMNARFCGTPFNIRNSEGQCEIYVGCKLPEGIVEDPTCRQELIQQIDNLNKSE